ncbi:MAG: lasso peptide biosynthesis B2 protein [Asticcacaulis sp.]|uniref:lasso peptide biosynthesis B2 protein n=1 Tax=Asticcacaulis sp. TaxID=1872648 RepID=UPI003F7C78CB
MIPRVSLCSDSGQLVGIDFVRDRYFMLPPDQASDFRGWLDGCAPRLEIRERFAALGLTQDGEPRAPLELFRTFVPAQSLYVSQTKTSPALMWRCAFALWQTRQALRHQTLRQILMDLQPKQQARADEAALGCVAAAYLKLRPFLPSRRICLKDSLALMQVLRGEGLQAKLVFGVKLAPFMAHCWVQTETRLLNETPDRARLFTPIWSL